METKKVLVIAGVALVFVVIVGLSVVNLTGKVVLSPGSYARGISTSTVEWNSFDDVINGKTVLPMVSPKFLRFYGTYEDNFFSNDYSYNTLLSNLTSEKNFKDYIVQNGDVLSFWVYATTLLSSKSMILPCGVEIDFTDGSTLRWTHLDQDGVQSAAGNIRSTLQWYQRSISISDMAGKRVKDGIKLVQESNQETGTDFTCFFDDIKIGQ